MHSTAASSRRVWMLLAFAAGCETPAVDEPAPVDLPMQIVVGDGAVSVYMEGADLSPEDCGCFPLRFPGPGECSFISDANTCDGNSYCQSCFIGLDVEVNGVRLAPTGYGGRDPWTRYYGEFPNGELSLLLSGCGHPTTRVALDGAPFSHPMAVADYVGGIAHVAWTTDVPATNTLLTLIGGSHGELCHVAGGTEHTFATWQYANIVIVEPAVALTDIVTEFGPATIWRVSATSAMFPPTP